MNSYTSSLVLMGFTALLITGCGFTPMYGDHTASTSSSGKNSVQNQLSQIEILAIPDRVGQMLRNRLIDRLYQSGYPSHPVGSLRIDPIAEVRTELDLTKSADATRAQLRLRSVMTLIGKDGKRIFARPIQSVTSFNILGSEFATHVTEEAARESAINDLARQVELNLSLYYNSTQ